ncbi:MAG: peptidylprolyl isomerase [Candidatus Peregrinibacteria bacterium]|nr:peptidylprolyl isomerase [Candidatus Peregrinibacteria bacterium]MCB9807941.1 peptidylprolyl isomerase [Candidatus Peribacteria bacterium]
MNRLHLVLIPLFALAILAGCSEEQPPVVENNPNANAAFDGTILKGEYDVVLHTSMGDITLELDADAAPKTVTNFIALAKMGYYDDLTFHRTIPDFMIQGGDPNGNGTGGDSAFGRNFEDEINANSYNLHKKKLSDVVEGELPPELKEATVKDYLTLQGYTFNDKLKSLPMKRGAIAMANRGPNTNGSQFFIIQKKDGTPWLEGKHTVFGMVKDGMDVVDAIATTETGPGDVPVEPVTFTVEIR